MITRSLTLAFALALGPWGCGDDAPAPPPGASRVVAVQADEPGRTPEAFCDVLLEPDAAKDFQMPELAEEIPADASKWRWVNVWATWCAPCVEEIPTLVEWEGRLGREGKALDLVLLSVDADAETVAAFRSEHDRIPESARISHPDAAGPWLASLGVPPPASLPVHILVDPRGKARCLRSGAIGDEDYAAIAALVTAR